MEGKHKINVPIDRIVPLTDARDNFSRIVADIENQEDGLYVLTKGGKPAIALVNIAYLSDLLNGEAGLPTATPAPAAKHHEVASSAPEKAEEKPKPAVPTTPPVRLPISATPPPSLPKPQINPSWTGASSTPLSINQPSTPTPSPAMPKPTATPWPIRPTAPAVAPINSPAPIASTPTPPPLPPMPPAVPPTPPPLPAMPPAPTAPTPPPVAATAPSFSLPIKPAPAPEPPKPIAPPPPPPMPPKPASFMNTPTPQTPAPASTPLPPPPSNPTTINFDQPPKTDLEPGEIAPPKPLATTSSTAVNVPITTNAAAATTPATSPALATPTPQPSVQDLDI